MENVCTCETKTTRVPNVQGLSLGVGKCPLWVDSKISNGPTPKLRREQISAFYCMKGLGRTLLELTYVLRPLEKVHSEMAGLIRLHVNEG